MKLILYKLKEYSEFWSTSYPSTTEEVITSKVKKRFKIGKDFFIGYSPEREDPGNKRYNLKNIPKIVSESFIKL